jgi:hypothetical protein
LTIKELTIPHGFEKASDTAYGGSLASNGSVVLVDSVVELYAAECSGQCERVGRDSRFSYPIKLFQAILKWWILKTPSLNRIGAC